MELNSTNARWFKQYFVLYNLKYQHDCPVLNGEHNLSFLFLLFTYVFKKKRTVYKHIKSVLHSSVQINTS